MMQVFFPLTIARWSSFPWFCDSSEALQGLTNTFMQVLTIPIVKLSVIIVGVETARQRQDQDLKALRPRQDRELQIERSPILA